MQQDGLVRLSLKRAFADGTIAVDMDPLSFLCRLATSVAPPRFDTVKYAGVLASASPWRKRIGPAPCEAAGACEGGRRARSQTQAGRLTAVGRACAPPVCDRCPRGPNLQGQEEARRHDHRAEQHRPLPHRARRAQRRSSSLTQPRAAVLQEHRRAPQGARGRRVAYLKNTPGQSNRLAGRRVPAARRCAPVRPLRRLRPALSSTGRGAATLAVPPPRFVAPHLLAQRSGFFYLRAPEARDQGVGAGAGEARGQKVILFKDRHQPGVGEEAEEARGEAEGKGSLAEPRAQGRGR
jgi:hypothetical protein